MDRPAWLRRWWKIGLLAWLLGTTEVRSQEPFRCFAFVSPQLIMTAEVAGPHSFILNLINLSEFVLVVQPSEFIYKGASGAFYIGQVFEKPTTDSRGQTYKYSASTLIKSKSFTGLTVLGAFRELDGIAEASIRIGARRYYMQPLGRAEFEILAAKIGELELESEDPQAALEQANLRPMGSVRTTDGTSEWDRDWQNLIREDGVNVPKIIERPPVAPTEEAIRTKTYGRVKLSALINRNGGLQDIRVEKGLGRGLDERAVEAVRNSWVFLPATKNGEVLEGRIEFYVDFPPAPPPKPPRSPEAGGRAS